MEASSKQATETSQKCTGSVHQQSLIEYGGDSL